MDIDRLQKIIESCHVNFLIGSGASRNFLDTLWNIENLLTSLDQETECNSDSYKLLETSIKFWYFDKCMRGNLALCDLKHKLTEDEQKNFGLTINGYQNFIRALNVILLKRKTSLLSKQVNLFTTNMDIFLDKVLDGLGVEFNDGFAGKFECVFKTSNYQKTVFKSSAQYDVSSELPLFNLFKLHGSLTWSKKSIDKITYDSRLSALKSLDAIDFEFESLLSLTEGVDEDLRYKNFEALKAESLKAENIDESKFATFKTEYEKLIMINPTKEKFENTTLRLEYYEQMRMYSNILEKENSVLFVTGFSFADEHIRQITIRALNSNPTLLVCVFCFDQNEKEKIDGLFLALKFNNLYTDFVNYDFQKTTNSIFVGIAKNLDANFYGQLNEPAALSDEINENHVNGSEPKQ
jgi:hypothetical protein